MWKELIVGAALALSPLPAAAATLTATFAGTALGINDRAGVLGVPGSFFARLGYTAVYVFDTSLGGRTTDPLADSLFGGIRTTAPITPLVSATLEIGGRTLAFAGNYNARVDYSNNNFLAYFAEAVTSQGLQISDLNFAGSVSDLPSTLDTPLALNAAAAAGLVGSFTISDADDPDGQEPAISGTLLVTSLVTKVDGFNPGPAPAPVPLPATGALLLLALGGLGLPGLRRKPGDAGSGFWRQGATRDGSASV